MLVVKAVDVSVESIGWLASIRLDTDELLSVSNMVCNQIEVSKRNFVKDVNLAKHCQHLKVFHSLLDDESN